jgi:hypothetical protein
MKRILNIGMEGRACVVIVPPQIRIPPKGDMHNCVSDYKVYQRFDRNVKQKNPGTE